MNNYLSQFKRFDWILFVFILITVLIGIASIYSSSLGGPYDNVTKQIVFLFIGVVAMFAMSFVDYRLFKDHSNILIFFYVISLAVLVLLFLFGTQTRGSYSWFRFGGISLEPFEFIKILVLLILAKYFSARHVEMYRARHIIISGLYVGLPVFLVLLQPDLGSAAVIVFVWLGIMFITGIKLKHFIIVGAGGLILSLAGWFFLFKEYQKARILSFLNPETDPLGQGYSIIQSLIAVGNGGFWGKGLGHGTQLQLHFLPEAHTDFIFSAFAEEFGLFGVIILLTMFGIIFFRIIRVSLKANNNFSRLYAAGFLIMILAQVFINVGMNIGLLPITGIPLPFLSYGGSSLTSLMVGVGILQSINIRG